LVAGVKTIGLVGGIGSGKSLAAEMLRGLGAAVVSADQVGHDVLADDADVRRALQDRWGSSIIAADGSLDRAAISRHVFAFGEQGDAERKFLESWVHPRIRQRLVLARDSLAAEGNHVVAIDAALLFEAGWNDSCNLVVFIDAPRPVRLARAIAKGWSAEQFAAREAAQWPVDEKRRRADVVIRNEGTPDDLRRAVKAFWDEYVAS
jgi:dephospho-CoA kinase